MNAYEQMREALKYTVDLIDRVGTIDDDDPLEMIYKECEKALALPRRNCDVGTAEEQIARFHEFCFDHKYYIDEFHGDDCREECPIAKLIDHNDKFCDNCMLVWAQMPYTEERKGEGDGR